jgi:fructose-1-phosphate kinase PfkB-like protein
MDSHVKRLDNVNNRLESVANRMQTSIGKSGVNQKNSSNENLDNLPILRDYNTILNGSLASFVTLSRKIGGELSSMIDHVTRLFDTQKEFLRQAIQTKKPTNDQQIAELIKPQSSEIEAIVGK